MKSCISLLFLLTSNFLPKPFSVKTRTFTFVIFLVWNSTKQWKISRITRLLFGFFSEKYFLYNNKKNPEELSYSFIVQKWVSHQTVVFWVNFCNMINRNRFFKCWQILYISRISLCVKTTLYWFGEILCGLVFAPHGSLFHKSTFFFIWLKFW